MIGFPIVISAILLFVPYLESQRRARCRPAAPGQLRWCCLRVIMIGALWWEGAASPWSPNFDRSAAQRKSSWSNERPGLRRCAIFHDRGCLNCHLIERIGGRRGPDLTYIA